MTRPARAARSWLVSSGARCWPLLLAVLGVACGGGSQHAGPPDPGKTAPTFDGKVRWLGRAVVDASDPNVARFQWESAGLVATVRGATLAARFHYEWTDTAVWFQPVVDGVPGARFGITAADSEREVTIAQGLGEGDHVLELYRDSEWHEGPVTFLGLTQGEVVGAPAWTTRLLEVVGDSISAGYGDLGGVHYTPEDSSWYLTYAAVAGRALGAEVSTVAYSGGGLYRDGSGGATILLGDYYPLALGKADPPWSFLHAPQAVVVNLGTNDVVTPGFDQDRYAAAGVQLVARIRDHAPDAWIFLAIGPMLGAWDERTQTASAELRQLLDAQALVVAHVQAAGDARISSFFFLPQTPDHLGADGHPDAAEHAIMAAVLERELHDKLGW